MIKETHEITIRKNSTCPAGVKVLDAMNDLKEGESLKIKSVIGQKLNNGGFYVYLDEESANNRYGFLKKIDMSTDEILKIAEEGNYEIHLYKREGVELIGQLDILVAEGAACQTSSDELSGELQDAIKHAVTNGYVTQEEMDARIKVFKENAVDDFLILRIIKRYRKYNKPVHKPSCIYVDPYLEQSKKKKSEGIISEGLRAAADRSAIICEGEKSVGKNVYLETIAWLMGMPMYLITFSRQMSPSSIYGEKTTSNAAAKALEAFDPDILIKADRIDEKCKFTLNLLARRGESSANATKMLQDYLSSEEKEILRQAAVFKKLQAQSASVNIVIDQSELYDWLIDGGVLVFNEMNMSDANFFASFTNQLLDGTGFLFSPGRGEVPIHKDCVLFGTQNAEYQGVEMQNEATMSRFGCLVFKQPESIKKQLIAATTSAIKKSDCPDASLSDSYYDECEAFYKQCRASVQKAVVTNACLNIRGFVRALTRVALSNGRSTLKRQIEIEVINTCASDDRLSLYAALEQIVTL